MGLALKLIDENLRHMVSGVVVLCPALLHPDFVPDEYKPMFKAYEENWIGAPVQDGQSMVLFYGKARILFVSYLPVPFLMTSVIFQDTMVALSSRLIHTPFHACILEFTACPQFIRLSVRQIRFEMILPCLNISSTNLGKS